MKPLSARRRSDREGPTPNRGLLLAVLGFVAAVPAFAAATAPDRGQIERLAQVRVPFVENRGQLDRRVAFSAPTFFGAVFVTRDGKLVYSLPPASGEDREAGKRRNRAGGWTLTETLVSGKPLPVAGPRAATGVSYFRGNDPKRWQSDLPTYEEIRLGEVWPGVAVSLRAHGGNVEKIFTLQSGARVEKIRLRMRGARSLRIDREGALVAGTGNGAVRFTAPTAYQERDGARHPVAVAYLLDGSKYGFRLGTYDSALPVIVDPLLQSTYLGGSDDEQIDGLTVHPASGEILVAGGTFSTDFPGTAGGAQPTNGGGGDGFVARLNPTLTTLLQATYLAGSSSEGITTIAVDPTSGEVLVAGTTGSIDFPGTTGAAQMALSGAGDGFAARLNSTVTTLLQATYLGGSNSERINDVVIHPASHEVLVAGTTNSTDFPSTAGGAQPAYGGVIDGFVARLNPALTSLLQATYLGGTTDDEANAISVHPTSGEVLVAGGTESSEFPGTGGGAQPSFGGGIFDGFLARLNSTLTTLLQATYLGGSGHDNCQGIAVRPSSGEVLVAGQTNSSDFPGTTGGAQLAHAGGVLDVFIARLDSTLTTFLQATYLGGSGAEYCYAIASLPPSGEILVTGATGSTDFPGTPGGAQPAYGGGTWDAFVARLDATLTNVLQTTYLGGNDYDRIDGIAIHPASGEVLVAGVTGSADFPGTAGGAQPAYGGGGSFGFGGDGFIGRLASGLAGGGVIPQAIAVDHSAATFAPTTSDGNGVFEPDETVTVSPSWTNGSPSAASTTGTASVFGDPPFATYAIPDPSADYGSIAAGDTASCAMTGDCFSLSLSAVFGRPTHFDTRFTETLSSGDYKFWTLHVGDSFADVPRNYLFYQKVETLLHHGITAGCTPTSYCPDDSVPRDQMAIFIAKAIAGGGANVPLSGNVNQSPYAYGCFDGGISLFTDVSPTDIFCKHVHYLAAQNVTLGCGPSLYCPTTNVARGEMAIFIARAVVAPAGGAAIPTAYGPDPLTGLSYSCDAGSPSLHFTDVTTSDSFCKHVHYLWAKGIIGGCSATEYCPADEVNRGAMAKFLANAFRLALYGP